MPRHVHHQAYLDAINDGMISGQITAKQASQLCGVGLKQGQAVDANVMNSVISNEAAGTHSPSLRHQQNAGALGTQVTFTEGNDGMGTTTVHVWQGSTCVFTGGYAASSQDADGYWLG